MPKYPFMARRKGSKNFYYKRPVPKALQAQGRTKQIWRSLNSDNEAAAKVAYRTVDAETDALFVQWRQDDAEPLGLLRSQSPTKPAPDFVPLTPARLRRLADAHYLNVYENDFLWRGDLYKQAVVDRMEAHRAIIKVLTRLIDSCKGDNRPDCPILDELSSARSRKS